MNIIILRHGEAEPYAVSDSQRRLTAKGLQQAAMAGSCLRRLNLLPTAVWASPYVRAQQTAAAVLDALNPINLHLETTEQLEPEADPAALITALQSVQSDCLLLVSHQPLVSTLVGILVNADPYGGPSMATASMALISTATALPGCGQLQWLRHAPTFDVAG